MNTRRLLKTFGRDRDTVTAQRPAHIPDDINSLFRDEAVRHAARRLEGDVILAIPLSLHLFGLLFVGILMGGAMFVVSASYARQERVQGWLQPDEGLIRAAALQGGVVDRVLKSEGEAVSADEPLVHIHVSSALEAGTTGELLLRDINLEMAAARNALIAGRQQLEAQQSSLSTQKETLLRELAEAQRRTDIANNRNQFAISAVERSERLLEQDAIAEVVVENAQSSALAAASEVSQARASQLALQRQLDTVEGQLSELPAQLAALEASTSQLLAQLSQRLTTAGSQDVYVVRAPVAGSVLAVPIEQGQMVPSGATVAAISPEGSTLVAELYIPSRAIGFIRVGQKVRLMYEAFPYQKFGAGSGVIDQVSQTVLFPEDIQRSGIEAQEPVFRVRVRLDKDTVDAYGEQIPLRPGMLLAASVTIDRRTLAEWLLDPIYAVTRQ